MKAIRGLTLYTLIFISYSGMKIKKGFVVDILTQLSKANIFVLLA